MYEKEKSRKNMVFNELESYGVELEYNKKLDILFSDLNDTLIDGHIGMEMLKNLDKEISEKSEQVMRTDKTKREKIESIAKLVEGKKISDIIEASKIAKDSVDLNYQMEAEIRRLKPTDLVIYTNTPKETADIYVREKIFPIYNSDGGNKDITVYGTILEEKDSILTGEVEFIPDQKFRKELKDFYKSI